MRAHFAMAALFPKLRVLPTSLSAVATVRRFLSAVDNTRSIKKQDLSSDQKNLFDVDRMNTFSPYF